MGLIDKALVIGGGIGGMCAAIELRKLGVAVTLVERNPSWAPDGAGITISGPTLRALRTVGVVEDVLRQGGHWSTVDVCDASGAVKASVPVQPAQGADELPGAGGILRPVLADILGRATQAAGATVRLGLSFAALQPAPEHVDVAFTDGSEDRFDLVIGADGLHSAVRRQLWPQAPAPAFTGQGSWRAVVPRQRPNSTICMGRTTKAGLNPISDSECYLFVLDRRSDPGHVAPEDAPRQLVALLEEFGGPVGEVRDALAAGRLREPRVLYRPLFSHIQAGPWHRGRVVLLGDAVHATTPHLASGAGIAVEGAVVLAQELARRHSVEGALLAYAGRHFDRAHLVVSASARMGELEQAGGAPEEHMRVMRHAQEALRAPL